MELTGFEISNYRSIGDQPVVLYPLQKCNILVGRNNSGKSNVLKALKLVLEGVRNNSSGGLTFLDLHRRNENVPVRFKLSLTHAQDKPNETEKSQFWNYIRASELSFTFDWRLNNAPRVLDLNTDKDMSDGHLETFLGNFTGIRSGNNRTGLHHELAAQGSRIFGLYIQQGIKPVEPIAEFRHIVNNDDLIKEREGSGLISKLAAWQHPDIGQEPDRQKYDKIVGFVKSLLKLPDDTLVEVIHDKSKIKITAGQVHLPLESFGAGVEQVLILVAAVLSIENSIVCIEEPEIHLHPELQRAFVDFILKNTTNQYFISTHSPALINAVNVNDNISVFHLRTSKDGTIGGPLDTANATLHALRDLGLRPSDLLQSNCVIWVEGRSDRTYLRRWLELVDPSLVEGRDYAIMFYGGVDQLQHISIDRDVEVGDLVNLLKINQNAIVVMDSDLKLAGSSISKNRRAVKDACESSGGIGWITDGREIENYIPSRVVEVTCKDLFDIDVNFVPNQYEKFDNTVNAALNAVHGPAMNYRDNKVSYAVKLSNNFVIDDLTGKLRENLDRVVAKLQEWKV